MTIYQTFSLRWILRRVLKPSRSEIHVHWMIMPLLRYWQKGNRYYRLMQTHADVRYFDRFSELSDLVDYFKESAGADDMASLPSLDLADDLLDDDDDFQLQQELQPYTPLPQSTASSSKPPRVESRTLSSKTWFIADAWYLGPLSIVLFSVDTRIVKPNHPPKKTTVKATSSVNLEPKLAKTFMPQKITRSSSNTLDSFYKRMVNLAPSTSASNEPHRGEATKDSIAKMKRAAVHGKATMKRAGSFTKSALSPRRPKRTVSMLSQAPQETGTVIMRRDNSIPNPETTPRTSLNRYLGTNLFADYSEACPVSRGQSMPACMIFTQRTHSRPHQKHRLLPLA